MIPLRIDPSSASEVVRASAILLIRLLQVHPGAWADEGPNSGVRQVELRIVIEQRLKGAVRQKPGEEFSLRVQQRRARATMDGWKYRDTIDVMTYGDAIDRADVTILAIPFSSATATLIEHSCRPGRAWSASRLARGGRTPG